MCGRTENLSKSVLARCQYVRNLPMFLCIQHNWSDSGSPKYLKLGIPSKRLHHGGFPRCWTSCHIIFSWYLQAIGLWGKMRSNQQTFLGLCDDFASDKTQWIIPTLHYKKGDFLKKRAFHWIAGSKIAAKSWQRERFQELRVLNLVSSSSSFSSFSFISFIFQKIWIYTIHRRRTWRDWLARHHPRHRGRAFSDLWFSWCFWDVNWWALINATQMGSFARWHSIARTWVPPRALVKDQNRRKSWRWRSRTVGLDRCMRQNPKNAVMHLGHNQAQHQKRTALLKSILRYICGWSLLRFAVSVFRLFHFFPRPRILKRWLCRRNDFWLNIGLKSPTSFSAFSPGECHPLDPVWRLSSSSRFKSYLFPFFSPFVFV